MVAVFHTPAFAQVRKPPSATSAEPDDEVALRSAVVVTGRRTVNSGGLGARSVLNTPFAVTTVTAAQISDVQATTVDEILRGDSSVRTASNGIVSILPEVTVRGLLLDQLNGYKIDGMAFPNRTNLPPEHFEQVELLKGLSGFMYGFGTPGGIVNYISKRPLGQTAGTIGVGFTSDATYRGIADINVRPTETVGLRLVGVHEEGDTYVDGDGHINRTSVSANTAINLGKTFTFLADGLYQKRDTQGVIFAAYIPAANTAIPMLKPVDGRTNLAETGSFFNTKTWVGTVGLDANLSSDWKANFSYRYAEMDAAWREGNVNITNAAGNYTFQEFTSPQEHNYNQAQLLIIGRADTGPVSHQLTFGASWQKLMQYNDRTPGTFNLVGTSNIYNPTRITGSFDNPYTHPLFLTLKIDQKAAFASDTLTWNQFSLLVGARYNQFEQTNLNAAGAVTAGYTKKPITPTVALRYKPQTDITFYGSYVEALEKGGQASVVNANYGVIYGPLKSTQYEIGAKVDKPFWDATLAVFRINRGAEYTNSSNIYVQDGESRFKGVELAGTIRPMQGLSLHAEAFYLDAFYAQAAPAIIGKIIPGAPKWAGGASIEYEPPSLTGLKLIANLKYVGDSKLETSNFRTVPRNTTVDTAIRYRLPISRPVTLNMAVKNIFNEKFWTVRNSGTPALQPGAPRTVVAGISMSF
jgi:iron complex outermembrane receptor protein